MRIRYLGLRGGSYLQFARASETVKLVFRGDASTATSARALTWHAPTQALFSSKTVTSCYLRLADRGVYIPLAMHNQQLCTNPNTFGVARSQSWRSWVGTSLFGLRPSTHC